MYTELKNYQLIIAMLKKYNIRNLVLSAGSRNVPFVHSVEKDPFFKCYSVVDERSAGYFALGLAQELNEPVLISCTASTASCNYYPPVAEAFYQNVPLVILTSDRDPEMLGQREDQMINQVGMFDRHVRKSVNLPIIYTKDNEYFCQRLLNEAFLELDHNGYRGPVHINVPMNSYNRTFNVKELPDVKKINRIHINNNQMFLEKINELKTASKIMVICGQKNYFDNKLDEEINKFQEKCNSIIIKDHMSNVKVEKAFNTVLCMDDNYIDGNTLNALLPDIVISFGGQVFSGLMGQLKKNGSKIKHWLISENGTVCDLFKGLDTIFECTPKEFFEKANMVIEKEKNNMKYYTEFKKYVDSIIIDNIHYSSMYAVKRVVENIPENSILHLSINDSIRMANFFELNKNVRTFSNIGTYGIDGCMSSFIGQSVATDNECFLIIGDLAFFYDMNSLKINSLKNNVHILLLNNHGGSEFYYNKTGCTDTGDLHTNARHNVKAEGWIKENNLEYLCSHNKEEFDKNFDLFMNSDKSVVFEVFTEMKTDAEEIFKLYDASRPRNLKSEITRKAKDIVKEKIGQEKAKKIIDILKK